MLVTDFKIYTRHKEERYYFSNQKKAQVLRGYFNNHYGAKAVVNALEFREILGEALSSEQQDVLEQARSYYTQKLSLSP